MFVHSILRTAKYSGEGAMTGAGMKLTRCSVQGLVNQLGHRKS